MMIRAIVRNRGVRSFVAQQGRCRFLSTSPPEGDEPKSEEVTEPEAEPEPETVDPLVAERDEFKNKWLRAMADIENTRTIARRDVANAREYAVTSFAKSMLEVGDSLGYALDAAKKEDASLDALVEGIDLTRSQLVKAFASAGLAEYGAVGDKFDPSLHDALFEYEDAEKDPGSVGQILKTGYTLHQRVIRAAQVGVVKTPPS